MPPTPVPPTLAALTGLRHLSLRGFTLQPEPAQQLDAVLPELTHLTCQVSAGIGCCCTVCSPHLHCWLDGDLLGWRGPARKGSFSAL